MASITVGPPPPSDRLSLESIPTVDLRLLTQSDLTALSLCSTHAFDLRRCDDVVIPKIDRSVFNESAGSRKQTYSRLRLAPRNKPNLTKPRPNPTPEPPVLDSERAENSRIISLFKHLFNSNNGDDVDNNINNVDESKLVVEAGDELALVPVSVAYTDIVPVSINHEPMMDGNRKRKRGRKPKLALAAEVQDYVSGSVSVDIEVKSDNNNNDYDKNKEEEEERNREEREKELVNRNGVLVDLAELAKAEDPYGEELRRRTEGREQPEELLGFIRDLEGQWGSRRKKRKIVDANEFGDALPNGWKVLIAMKKKQGRAWVFCRRYISPNGRYFVSCKEVSSYLLSLTGAQELKQQTTVQWPDNSVVNNVAFENAADIEIKMDDPSLQTSQFNDHENQQLQLFTSQTVDHAEQLILSKEVHLREEQAASALKCHKCSSPFTEKDELLNHLISCHKRKRRKSNAPVEDDVIMKEGKYECQFCSKLFHERNSYFGHVGIHVKNYVKSISGTPGLIAKQRTSDPGPPGEVHVIVSPGEAAVNGDSCAGTSNILASSELNVNTVDSKMTASSDAETHITNGNNVQNNLFLRVDRSAETGQTDKTPADESSAKQDGTDHITDNNVMEVNEATDFPAVKLNNSSGPDKMLYSNEKNDLNENSSQLKATESVGSELSKSPALLVENAETCLFPDIKKVHVENDGGFVAVKIVESERVASENYVPADSEEKSSSNNDSADGSLGNEAVEHDGLMVGSASGHLDPSINAEDDVLHSGALGECSGVRHIEEKRSGVTVNKIELMGTTVGDSKLERGSETSCCTPSGDQQTPELQNKKVQDATGLVNEVEVDLCSLENTEVTINAARCIAEERHSESGMLLVSRDNGSNYFRDEAETVSDVVLVEPTGTRGFQVGRSCRPENSPGNISDREVDEPKSDQVVSTSNLYFTSGSCGTDLNASCMTNNDQAVNDVSDVLGAFSSFVEDKQEQVPKSIFSDLSMNENGRDAIIDVMNVSSTTTSMQLPELNKGESSRSNKLILDFGNMTEINARFMSSVEHESVPEETLPFSLWGQQTCGLEDNQTRVYGGSRGLAQQESASDNNSLNLAGLQQPSDAGYNLNKVCMNEQRYVQHNETGGYSRSNEARREAISHGNTLNLAGFQQQCDTGYNLNKPCITQQSYGVQHNEAGAYTTCDEARQERVSYGNSLSLASVQQTCDSRYSLNKACAQQSCDTGYSLNKGYMETFQGLSKLDELGHSRDRDLMIGFGNSDGRANQATPAEFLWRSNEGNVLPGGLVASSSSQGQSSGSFQAFDFLSDKGGNDLYTANDKFDNMSSFEGLRSSVEPMEFSFMTSQESDPQLEHEKVLSYNTQMDQGFGGSVWNQKATPLPNMMAGHVVSTMCVWCGNEFHQDPLNCEMQAGSIGYLCPTCKARMSGQFL